jgi:hypothetical protein
MSGVTSRQKQVKGYRWLVESNATLYAVASCGVSLQQVGGRG